MPTPFAQNMVCERPPAGRFAPRLSPFVRGTLQAACGGYCLSVPLTKGDSRGAKRPAGGSLTSRVAGSGTPYRHLSHHMCRSSLFFALHPKSMALESDAQYNLPRDEFDDDDGG
jgi:hypothetical protein